MNKSSHSTTVFTANLDRPASNRRSLEHHWDEVAAIWGNTRQDRLWRNHSDMVNTKLLRRWLKAEPKARILKTDIFDEAVASGIFPLLAEQGLAVTAIDISRSVIRLAHKRYPHLTAYQSDVRALPFSNGSFDRIVSLSTLDHFESEKDIHQSLRELNRVMRSGGELICTLDNTANPLIWLRNRLPSNWLRKSGIVPYFIGQSCGPRRFAQAVKEAGFQVLDTSAILHAPRVFAVAISRLLGRALPSIHNLFLRSLLCFEMLERLPTRNVTGHFVAIRARKL